MQIEELGTLSTFEPMPTEAVHYVALVSYGYGWSCGPCSVDKADVIERLQNTWSNCKAARIYSVRLPINALPATPKEEPR